MNLKCIDPQTSLFWQKLVEQHKSDVFHSPAWIKVLNDTYNFNVQALVTVDQAGEPKAGLTYCKIEDMMDPRIASLPFSDFCDPLVDNQDDWNCLMSELLAEGCRVNLRCLHNRVALDDDRLELVNRGKWHCIDLQQQFDTIWNNLHGSAKRAIKKAERNGVIVKIAQSKEELRAFFELHLGVRKYKYNLLAQPYAFFENIWDAFIGKQQGALMLAVYENEIIGGVMFLEWKDTLYYKFNASHHSSLSVRPNDLVIWEGIKYGQAKGYKYLDFGISDWDQEGLVRYKRKFATEEKTISFLRYTPNGGSTQKDKQVRNLLPQLTELFTDETVPDSITEKAGETLYRFFT